MLPCGVKRILVTLGDDPPCLRTDTGLLVPNSNILTEPSALPVRSNTKREKKDRMMDAQKMAAE